MIVDLEQRNALIEEQLCRVRKLARMVRYSRPACFDVEELNSVGLLALTELAREYDPSKGEFWPFVKPWILGAMLDSSSGKAWRDASHLELDPSQMASGATAEEMAIAAERRRAVQIAVKNLPQRQRRVVTRVNLRGDRSRDVARVLRIAESTVAGLKRQAFKRLRKELVA